MKRKNYLLLATTLANIIYQVMIEIAKDVIENHPEIFNKALLTVIQRKEEEREE